MKTSQTLDIRKSEIKQKLNELSAKGTLEDGEAAEIETLRSALSEKETQYRAALTVEGAEEARAQGLFEADAETRELAQLTSGRTWATSCRRHSRERQTSGESAELKSISA